VYGTIKTRLRGRVFCETWDPPEGGSAFTLAFRSRISSKLHLPGVPFNPFGNEIDIAPHFTPVVREPYL